MITLFRFQSQPLRKLQIADAGTVRSTAVFGVELGSDKPFQGRYLYLSPGPIPVNARTCMPAASYSALYALLNSWR